MGVSSSLLQKQKLGATTAASAALFMVKRWGLESAEPRERVAKNNLREWREVFSREEETRGLIVK